MRKALIKKVFHIIFIFVISIIFIGSIYFKNSFSGQSFDELVFYIKNGVIETDSNVFFEAVKMCGLWIIIIFIILVQLFYDLICFKKSRILVFIRKHKIIMTIILFLLSFITLLYSLNYFDYWKNNRVLSTFIKDNYVDPREEKILFKEKKNLIFIVVESLESTFFTKEQGGEWDYEIIPELYNLLNSESAISFSSNDLNTGMHCITGSNWTTASLFANTSGLPFIVPVDQNKYYSDNFMNGAYTLGDLLLDNGYTNELISSARTSFGGIREMYAKHGKYNIIDSNSLKNYGYYITKKERSSWGINDKYMFEIAKERLTELSKNKEPFSMQLVTIDTHFPNGLVQDYTLDKYNNQYENVYATESKLIGDFVSWVKEQEYYKDTVIVIIGDHLNMQKSFFKNVKDNNRYIYNVIINSSITTKNNKNRSFSSLDIYPTIVSAIGGKYNNKLGLGVNLFSNEQTLIEKNSVKYLNSEFKKKSIYYNKNILKKDYYKLAGKINN